MSKKTADVIGLEGLYFVTIDGRIFSKGDVPKEIIPNRIAKTGGLSVTLRKDGYTKVSPVGKLVYEAFNGETSKKVVHIDGNKSNCALDNLEAVEHREVIAKALNKPGKPTGVWYHKTRGQFFACVYLFGKHVKYGPYTTEEQAAKKYSEILAKIDPEPKIEKIMQIFEGLSKDKSIEPETRFGFETALEVIRGYFSK